MSTNTNTFPSPPYRADIDGLRAIAVLLVLVFHAFPTQLPGGFIGVDIFFVISGYLITGIIFNQLKTNNFSFLNFYVRRINRIFPVLLIVLLGFFILGWFALLANEFKAYGKFMAAAGLFSSNLALWKAGGYFDTAADLKPLLHLWSLGIEEQFYLIWPFFIWAAYKKQINILALTLVFFGISYFLNLKGVNTNPTAAFYLPQSRFFELLMGSLLAVSHSLKPNFSLKSIGKHYSLCVNTLAFAGLVCITGGVYYLNPEKVFPGNNALLPVLGTALLIAAGTETWINRKLLANRIMVGIGLISFSLYLWHWPLLSFARIMEQGMPSKILRVGCLALSFLLAFLSYLYIEKPIRFGDKQKLKALLLLSLSFCIIGLGLYTYYQEGFLSRTTLTRLDPAPEFPGKLPPDIAQKAIPVGLGISSHRGKKTVIILGDSHAHHLLAGFFQKYPENHISIILGPGCPFLLGIDRKTANPTCLSMTEQALSDKELASVKTVIFSFRMFAYNRSGFDYNSEKQDWSLWYKSKRQAIDDLSFWGPALRETLQLLITKHKRVIISYDVPELFRPINECLDSRPLYLHAHTVKNCNMPRKIVDQRQAPLRQLFAEILKEFPQVETFDPLNYFCDKKWCYAFNNGLPLYYDDDHLSAEGSKFYAAAFAKEYPSLINKNV
ncbi:MULTISPECIES: acyltransferase family protein [Legionella]|uniref:O-antigen acetylase n=1 Tax=Legionella drozanskii LLAP-1 TaxID=1212489 RepID=A0A0W0TDT9_9GAMM|nr:MULTISPECIES: acyltransferase family protein [Legionella]KTC93764.1 O-antigen acetylase [Legionella drozanskii LLAP-1]PJE13578.1 MAG: acyltransferase [Legionella sp.]